MYNIADMQRGLLDSPPSTRQYYTESGCQSDDSDTPIWQPFKNNDSVDNLDDISDDMNEFSDDDEDDELTPEKLRASIEKKELLSDQMSDELTEMRERFIWELALAMKKNMLVNYHLSAEQIEKISCKGIQSIVSRLDIDNPQPHEWLSWIEGQYRNYLGL